MVMSASIEKRSIVNKYDKSFKFSCPVGKSISGISSSHNSHHEDRLFDIKCYKSLPVKGSRKWSSYVNDYDKKVSFTCGPQSVISGMGAVHSNRREDRRYRFNCTFLPGYRETECRWTYYLNDYDGIMNYEAKSGYYITGMYSKHDNKKEDRRFKIKECKIVKI